MSVPGWDDYFLSIAKVVSTRAKCTRRKVGAVLVLNRRILSTGYNGSAPGEPECIDGGCPRGLLTYEQVVGLGDYDRIGSPGFCISAHAEINALLYSTQEPKGGTLYITDPPCPGCRKAMAAAGVSKVVWPTNCLDADKITDWEIEL